MTNGNGHKEEKQPEPKHCPLLNESCIGQKCALYSELIQNVGGVNKRIGTCAFVSMVVMLSEINQKAAISQQQKIQLPHGLMSR